MIELAVWAGVGAVVFGSLFVQSLFRRRHRRDEWAQAAAASGLTEVETSGSLLGDHLRARAGPLEVTIEADALTEAWKNIDAGRTATPAGRVHVRIDGLAAGIGLASEQGGLRVRPDARELQVGDPFFDPHVFLQGPPALLFALLDAPARAQVLQATLWAVKVADGRLMALLEDRFAGGGHGSPLSLMLPALLRLAHRLRQPPDLAARLAEHVREEALDEVRLWNLVTLAREYPEHPATREALRHACGDAYDELRLRAALMLGAEGRDVLLEFARGARGDDSCAARAVEALGGALDAAEVRALLEEALREERPLAARALVLRLGRAGDAAARSALAAVLAGDDGDLAEAAATALGAHGAHAEGLLVGALGHRLDFVRAAAARALGRAGSTAAVLPLREVEAAHPRDAELRRVAREAVAAIQARTGGATPGRLSLAVGSSGQVSLTTDETGHVSFPDRG
jgi:hypothetical protein